MKLKRIMAMVLCFAMVLGTMSFNVFAEETTYVAKVGDVECADASEMLSALNAASGEVIVEIYGKLETSGISINNANIEKLSFVGKSTDAEIGVDGASYIDVRSTQYPIEYTDMTLSHTNGAYGIDGRLQEYFSTYNGGNVTYTNCTFPNGVTALGSTAGTTVTFNQCAFNNLTSGKYSLWVDGNGTEVVVNGGTFCGVRGAKLFAENGSAFSTLEVNSATFSDTITEKAAVVLTRGEKVVLEDNTFENTTDKVQVDDDYASEINGKTVIIGDTEYTVDSDNLALEEKVSVPSGSNSLAYTNEVYGYVRVWGEGGGNAKESFVLKLYSEDVLIATTQLNNVGGIIDGDVYVTWNFFYPESNDEYWTTSWEEGHPNAGAQPTKVELYIDGTCVATTDAKMSGADDVNPVVWSELGGVAPAIPSVIEIYDWEDLKELDALVESGNMLEGVTVKLMNDIDLYEMGTDGEPVSFNPIGANSAYFKGTFDGQGYTIKNMYQSGWALGYDWYNYGTIGLFAYIWDATVKNVTIENAECFVEGGNVAGIAGCAWGNCTFENITIKNSTYATYNNRAAGIVGYTGGEGTMTFKDITVDEDTVIAALWGSYDCTLGGVVGSTKSPTKYHFEDVTVECKLDCYNDVTASYKWYSYRMCGMLIGRMETLQTDAPTEVDPRGVVTIDNVKITIGEWANQTYIFDDSLSKGCQRVEPGYSYGGVDVSQYPDAEITELGFSTIIGGPQSQSKGYYGSDITKLEALEGFDTTTLEVEDLAEIARNHFVAQIGDDKFGTLADAIAAAQPNDTITLLDDVTEDVTINKSITLDGGNFKYTGNISVSGTTSEVTVKNVNFENGTGYAITTNRIKSITVVDCTVNNYGFGFLYANKSTPTVVVKNVTVDGGNYGFHWVYGTSATLENVTMTNVTNGLLIQNYAGKTVTLKNCNLTNINIWEKATGVQTFKFEGTNTVATLSASQYAKYVLTAVDATLTAPEGSDVTTDLEGYFVKNVDGTYKVAEKVAQIGDNYYSSLQEAIDSAADNATITLVKDIANGTGVKVNSGKNFTLDLGGFTYTIASNPVGSKGTETLGFQLLKDSNITIKNGIITSEAGSNVKLLVMNYANLTLDGVTLNGANLDDVTNAGGYVMSNNNGTTVIKDSTIIAPTDGVAFDVDYQASYPNGAKVSLEGATTINGAIDYEDNAKNSLTKDASVALDAPEGYKWVKVGAKYSLQVSADYKFVVEADTEEIIDSGSFKVYVKVSSEKMDDFYSAEYIVTYDTKLLTCAIDNVGQDDYVGKDYDKTPGTLRLQCLDGAGVNEVIDTLEFTTKDFYLTQTATIEVAGTVCATQYDASSGSSDTVIGGEDSVELKDSFVVDVRAGLEGADAAYNKTDYVVSVAAENQGKQNTIKYTIKDADGNPVEYSVILPAGTNEYTISGDAIVGDMTFEIADAYSIEIILNYVTGYALILVDGTADGYTYNGHQMFKISCDPGTCKYDGRYGWLVDGTAEGTTTESVKAAAYAAIRAGGESKAVERGYDVNSYINGDGMINFYDVSAAYACQKVDFALSDIDDYYYMELYLASDTNCDGKVDSLDSAEISINYN